MMRTSEAATFELLSLTVSVSEKGTSKYRNSAGQVHRLHGPAVIWADGDVGWYWGALRHRVGGPALFLHSSKSKVYFFLFDEEYTKEEYEIECANKTNPLWKEYDAELQQYVWNT